MPVKSAKQFRFMQAVKGGKIKGVEPSVGSEFLSKTSHKKKSEFAKEDKFKRAFRRK